MGFNSGFKGLIHFDQVPHHPFITSYTISLVQHIHKSHNKLAAALVFGRQLINWIYWDSCAT